jgi:predicted PurR-regulated permease PerM
MSEPESPVLRLIPYLAAITVTVFATLSVVGTGDSNLLVTLVVAVVGYFGTYYLTKLIIHVIVTRIDVDRSDQD